MATTSRNYYDILGVAHDADEKTIKNAFRDLALQYHPDRNKAPGAEEKFKEIAEAYAILSNPQKRAAYDAGGMTGAGGVPFEDLFSGIDFSDIFGGLDLGFGNESIFERFLHRRRPPGPPQGAHLEVAIAVPLERILTGGQETVHLTRPATCAVCHGSGAHPDTPPRRCEPCQGTGQRITSRRDSGVMLQQITPCPTCHGRGSIIDQPCTECHGRGETERPEDIQVTIPAGVEEGMALRIPGHGLPSREGSGPPGDLFVVVHSTPDARFERQGADLWHLATVSLVDAVLGTTLDVSTLDGHVTVTIPPGTQPDTVLRLHGKGLPVYGQSRRGSLYLRLRVHVPERLSATERQLYEQLRAVGQKET
jgi:molecular chaperone DnaJ